jgi:hypothetical protein
VPQRESDIYGTTALEHMSELLFPAVHGPNT